MNLIELLNGEILKIVQYNFVLQTSELYELM